MNWNEVLRESGLKRDVRRCPVGNKNNPSPALLVQPTIKRSINFGANGAQTGRKISWPLTPTFTLAFVGCVLHQWCRVRD